MVDFHQNDIIDSTEIEYCFVLMSPSARLDLSGAGGGYVADRVECKEETNDIRIESEGTVANGAGTIC